jgi:hypothetical protein
VQHEGNPLIVVESLEHHHRGESRVFPGNHCGERIVAVQRCDDRLGQPFAVVGLSSVGGRTQPVQCEPADHRRQPRPQVRDLIALGTQAIPSEPGILDDVLGIGERAGESIGHRHQVCPQPFEVVDPGAHTAERNGKQSGGGVRAED